MTRNQRVALLLAAAGIIATTSGVGARQSQSPAAAPKFGTATSGVLLDVVVRDKKGPVMDLTQDDFTVTENGAPQQILTFDKRTSQETSVLAMGFIITGHFIHHMKGIKENYLPLLLQETAQ